VTPLLVEAWRDLGATTKALPDERKPTKKVRSARVDCIL
jgi:hypothetical protein